MHLPEAVVHRCSLKYVLLKILQISRESTLCSSLFLTELQTLRPATLLKIDSHTGVFLYILRTPLVAASDLLRFLFRTEAFDAIYQLDHGGQHGKITV